MILVVHGAIVCGQKRSHKLLSRFPANDHLPQASHQSRLLANDKDDTDMYRGLCTGLLESNLLLRKAPQNLSW
jgi:hypothetical protein